MKSKKKASGGTVVKEPEGTAYNAKDSQALKDAREKNKGGAVKKKDGGKVERAAGGPVRLDRKPRKGGGRVGSNKNPLSSASSVGARPGGNMEKVAE